jgi:copper transport protein
VPSAPETVEFDFNEPVETDFGAVRVFGPDGTEVQEGEVFHPGNAGAKAAINLKPGLGEGTYTATYRVISADSHPVSGGLTFSVGESSAGGAGVSELLASEKADPVTETAFVIARAFLYAALALGLGGLVFLARPWARGLAAARAQTPEWEAADSGVQAALRLALTWAAGVGLLMTLLTLGLQAAVAGGESLWASLDPEVAGELLGTRFGMVWAAAAGLWVVFGAAILASGRNGSIRLRLLLPPLVLIAAAPALAGHASTQNPVWLLLPLTFVHVVAMACWAGGLMTLLGAVPAATRRLEPTDRSRLLANVLTRFSTLALIAVATILITGITQSIAEIGSFEALFGSAFGRAVLIKFALLVILIGLGTYQRRRIVPGMESLAAAGETPAQTGARLRRILQAEIALIAVIMIVTGALASYSPPTTAASGPETATATIGPAAVNLTVDPATIGQNELHFYLSDAQTGDPFDAFKEFDVSLSLPERDLGPLKADVEEAGPGHYLVPVAPLGARGEWEIRMEGLLSKFSEQSGEATVAIR